MRKGIMKTLHRNIRIIVDNKRGSIIMLFITFSLAGIWGVCQNVIAKQSNDTKIQYNYDALGRVKRAVYSDGSVVTYSYDANGNLIEMEKTDGAKENTEESEKTTERGKETQNGETTTERKITTEVWEQIAENEDTNNSGEKKYYHVDETRHYIEKVTSPTWNPVNKIQGLCYTEKDVKNYNAFKKKIPKTKSLKCKKYRKKKSKKKVFYISIGICQVHARGDYGEIGYQISYSTDAKFKKSKRIDLPRRKKGKTTFKKWKVEKGKTYYVKVRAYMYTRTGKKIYTKYSKVKNIKVAE